MEDLIAFVFLIGLGVSVVSLAVWAYKRHKRKSAEAAIKLKEREEMLAKWKSERKSFTGMRVNASGNVGIGSVPARGKETTKKYAAQSDTRKMEDRAMPAPPSRSFTPTTDTSDDGFLTGMLTGYALNTIMSGSGRSSEATEERSSSVSKSESSSWGLDDDDSRKSVSSTFSDSWSSSSSSSDSWSSSSDSGPSSDW